MRRKACIAFMKTALCLLMLVPLGTAARSFLKRPPPEKESLTTDTWSSSFANPNEKLAFLEPYFKMFSPVLEAEYHIEYHDNAGGWVPGPSDYDIRVALKVAPEDIPLWTEGFDRVADGEIDMAWWDGLSTPALSWEARNGAPGYKRPNRRVYLIVFADEGIVLKRITTL